MNYGNGTHGYGGILIGIKSADQLGMYEQQLGMYEQPICKIPFTGKSSKAEKAPEQFVQKKEEPVQFKTSQETSNKEIFPAREFKEYKKIDREFKHDKR